MTKYRKKYNTVVKAVSILVACLFLFNSVSWGIPARNLQPWYLFKEVADQMGSDYNSPQFEIEMVTILAMVLKDADIPFRNINSALDKLYSSSQVMDRVLSVIATPQREGDSVAVYVELLKGPRKGEKFRITFKGDKVSEAKEVKVTKIEEPPQEDADRPTIVHAEAFEIKTDNIYYDKVSLKYLPGIETPLNISSMPNANILVGFLALHDAGQLSEITIQGKKINLFIDKDLNLDPEEIKEFIESAWGSAGGDIKDLPGVLVFTVLDKSSHLFEDHLANGFIGVNRAVLNEIKDPKVRENLLRIGLVHELSHEVTKQSGEKFEKEQLARDGAYVMQLFAGKAKAYDELSGFLSSILTSPGAFFGAVEEYGIEKIKGKGTAKPLQQAKGAGGVFPMAEVSKYYAKIPEPMEPAAFNSFSCDIAGRKFSVNVDERTELSQDDVKEVLAEVLGYPDVKIPTLSKPMGVNIEVFKASPYLFMRYSTPSDDLHGGAVSLGMNAVMLYEVGYASARKTFLKMGLFDQLARTFRTAEVSEAGYLKEDALYIAELSKNDYYAGWSGTEGLGGHVALGELQHACDEAYGYTAAKMPQEKTKDEIDITAAFAASYEFLVGEAKKKSDDALTALGIAYPALAPELPALKDEVYGIIIDGVEAEAPGAYEALGHVLEHLDNEERYSAYELLAGSAKMLQKAHAPYGLLGLARAFPSLGLAERKEVFGLVMDAVNMNSDEASDVAVEALCLIYGHLDLLDKKARADAQAVIRNAAKNSDSSSAAALGYIYADLSDFEKGKTLASLLQEADTGNEHAIRSLSHVYIYEDDFDVKAKIYSLVIGKAKEGNQGALRDIGLLYPVSSDARRREIRKALLFCKEETKEAALVSIAEIYAFLKSEPSKTGDQAMALKLHIDNTVKIVKDFREKAMPILFQAAEGKGSSAPEALEALGAAYGGLPEGQREMVYSFLMGKAPTDKTDENDIIPRGAIRGLGHLYRHLDDDKRKEVFEAFKKAILIYHELPAAWDHIYPVLGENFDLLPVKEREELYDRWIEESGKIIGTHDDRIRGAAAVLELGRIYRHLTKERQEKVYEILLSVSQSGTEKEDFKTNVKTNAIKGLGMAYAYLPEEKKKTVYPLLEDAAATADVPLSDIYLPIAYAYGGMTPLQREEIYGAYFGKSIMLGSFEMFAALREMYEFLSPQQQKSAYFFIIDMMKKPEDKVAAAFTLATLYTKAKIPDDAVDIVIVGDIAPEEGKKPAMSVSNAAEIMKDFKGDNLQPEAETVFLKLFTAANSSNAEKAGKALEGLGAAYGGLPAAMREEVLGLLLKKADEKKDNGAVRGLARAFRFLNETDRQHALVRFEFLKSVPGYMRDYSWIIGTVYGDLEEAEKKEVYEFLGKQADAGSLNVLYTLGCVYQYLPEEEKKKVYLQLLSGATEKGSLNAYLGLGKACASLAPDQKAVVYAMLRAKAEDGTCLPLAYAFGGLSESQRDAVYGIFEDNFTIRPADMIKVVEEIYCFLKPGQQKEAYNLVKDIYSNSGLWLDTAVTIAALYAKAKFSIDAKSVAADGDIEEEISTKIPTDVLDLAVAGTCGANVSFCQERLMDGSDNLSGMGYVLFEPRDLPSVNKRVRAMMQVFDRFETLNFETLALLNKKDKTVGEFYKMLEAMKQMAKVYLFLFKDQPLDRPLEEIAVDPSDLVGGRTVAKVMVDLDKTLKARLDQIKPEKTTNDALPQEVEAMVQRFDGEKTTALISKGAEIYNAAEIQGISFAEFINVVHQKGIRNLSSLVSNQTGAEKQVIKVGMYRDSMLEDTIKVSYFDARVRIASPVALPAKYAALAFAKGQLVHNQQRLFRPEEAIILSDEKRAIIGMHLGCHSARIQFSLMPVQEGGRVVINYTDSGAAFAPGSDIRIKALAKAFAAAGFRVHQSGYAMDAYFDKDSGAKSIDELPGKLTFAVQALSSTRDLDVKFNNHAMRSDPDAAAEMMCKKLAADGYLERGRAHGELTENTFRVVVDPWLERYIMNTARELGVDISQFPYFGQRALDRIYEVRNILFARDAIEKKDGKYSRTSAYREALLASPVASMIARLGKSDSKKIKDLRRIAAVARAVESFATRRLLGSVGPFHVEQLALPLLGDRVTFYVLKDPEDGSFRLAFAVLGECFFDRPRVDTFRGKKMETNELSFKDLEEIMTPQNMTTSENVKEWARALGASKDDIEKGIFRLIEDSTLLDAAVPEFEMDELYGSSQVKQGLSDISTAGVIVSGGFAVGKAVLNTLGRKPADFAGNILIAPYTEPSDDPSIKEAGGIVVTTGGVLSHAAIRSREHGKPALILNGAEFSPSGLRFRRFKGAYLKKETAAGDRTITYHELSDYGEEERVVRNGDIVCVDARNGNFYVIADASDARASEGLEKYLVWKDKVTAGWEKAGEGLKDILRSVDNANLLRAIVSDVVSSSVIPAAGLEEILGVIIKERPETKSQIIDFLRGQAEAEVAAFKKAVSDFTQLIAATGDVEQVYLAVDGLSSRAKQLEHLMQISNGNWESGFTMDALRAVMKDVMEKGGTWLSSYREKTVKRIGRILEDPKGELSTVMRVAQMLLMAGVNLRYDMPGLFAKRRELREQRIIEVKARIGRGIIRKEDLKDRFARPLAGGKGAHSGEIINALGTLKKAGLLAESNQVTVPHGFVIQPEEYRLWVGAKKPPELNEPLRKELTREYRNLVITQARDIVSMMESDERTDKAVKEKVLTFLSSAEMLRGTDDPLIIDAMIGVVRAGIAGILALYERTPHEKAPISNSLEKRLEVFGAVAVRSSGLKEDSELEAMAGMKKTVLNVAGLKDIFGAVIEVWGSGAEGVLVEEMINAKVSGVAFSADPIMKRTDTVRINSAYGLAKGLVDQLVEDPDSFLVKKGDMSGKKYVITASEIGAKEQMVVLDTANGRTKVVPLDEDAEKASEKRTRASLNEKQVRLVAEVVDKFSQFFGFQVDMEFSFDSDDRLVVLQVRPITTMRESIMRGRRELLRAGRKPPADAAGPAHFEAMRISRSSRFYGKTSVKDGKTVRIGSPKEAEKWAAENLEGKAGKYTVAAGGRAINVIIEKELGMTEDEIGALINAVLVRTKSGETDLPQTLVFAVLDSSSHLFEDHIANGFIGINRAVTEGITDKSAAKAMLKIGLFHELSHEATGEKGEKFERKQLKRDVEYAAALLAPRPEMVVNLGNALGDILDGREFINNLSKKMKTSDGALKRKRDAILNDARRTNDRLFSAAKAYLLKLAEVTAPQGENIPVDITIDLSLIGKEDIEGNAEIWSSLILSCLEIKNVNFVFEFPVFKGERGIPAKLEKDIRNAAEEDALLALIRKKLKYKAAVLNRENDAETEFLRRVNAPRRENAIEVPIVSALWLMDEEGREAVLEPDQYPVALEGAPAVPNKAEMVSSFEAALAIGLSKASLVAARRMEEDDLPLLRKQVCERMQALYRLFIADVTFDEETLDDMIHPASKVRVRLALSLALPPMAKVVYEKIKELYDVGRRVMHSA